MHNTFLTYKEDTDLSFRLRKKKWRLVINSDLMAYHCRGWNPDRKKIPKWEEKISARNDMRINFNLDSPYFIFSFQKYVGLRFLNI